MDALVRALKQNILATGSMGFILVAFFGFVLAPGLTSSPGGSKQATPTTQAAAKDVIEVSKTDGASTSPSSASTVGSSQPLEPTQVQSQQAASPPLSETGSSEYIVKSGDTLSGIADRFNTTAASLVAFNELSGDLIGVGQKLKIPESGASAPTEAPNPVNTPTAPVASAAQATSTPTEGAPVSTPTPKPTNTPAPPTSTPTPKPTNTAVPPTAVPKPAVDYVVQSIHRLTGCENHGMLRTNVIVLDRNGSPLNGVNVVRYTNTGEYAGNAVSGDKGPGMVEFSNEGPGMGGNWHVVIEMPSQTSETAFNLRTDLGSEDMPDAECGGELGSYFKHISYDVVFKKTS